MLQKLNQSASDEAGQQVEVWDLPIRLFHWAFACLTLAALLTGLYAPEWWLDRHLLIGAGLGGLLVFRIVWGFAGGRFARFSSFAYSPRALFTHLRRMLSGAPEHHLGHNPAGAMMVFALLLMVALMGISGLLALGGVEKEGPLAWLVDFESGWLSLRLHRFGAYLIAAMLVLHVAGVILQSRLEGQNLARAMITGRKRLLNEHLPPRIHKQLSRTDVAARNRGSVRPGRALAFALFLVLALAGLLEALSGLPVRGARALTMPASFRSECGDCHMAYHPALLPAASWRAIMDGLEDHFGEDATLDEATRAEIERALIANSAETWDTKASHFFRVVDPAEPKRITRTPGWRARHAAIPAKVFKQKSIASKSNCGACHRDARRGTFADRHISIPAPRPGKEIAKASSSNSAKERTK